MPADRTPKIGKGKPPGTTSAEMERRTGIVYEAICSRYTKTQVRKLCWEQFGVRSEAADNLWDRAMDRLKSDFKEDRDENRRIGIARSLRLGRKAETKDDYSAALTAEKHIASLQGTLQQVGDAPVDQVVQAVLNELLEKLKASLDPATFRRVCEVVAGRSGWSAPPGATEG